jgi:hypothetical protein
MKYFINFLDLIDQNVSHEKMAKALDDAITLHGEDNVAGVIGNFILSVSSWGIQHEHDSDWIDRYQRSVLALSKEFQRILDEGLRAMDITDD